MEVPALNRHVNFLTVGEEQFWPDDGREAGQISAEPDLDTG